MKVRQKRALKNRKMKLVSLNKYAAVLTIGKTTITCITPGRTSKKDNTMLIEATNRISITRSDSHEKRQSELILTVNFKEVTERGFIMSLII